MITITTTRYTALPLSTYLYHISFHACICFRPVFFAPSSLALSLVLGSGIQDDPEPWIYKCHFARAQTGQTVLECVTSTIGWQVC